MRQSIAELKFATATKVPITITVSGGFYIKPNNVSLSNAILETKAILEFAKQNNVSFEEEKSSGYREYAFTHVDEYHNVFFTEKGYKEHMELNAHNYHSSDRKADSYVMHAFRNPEITGLLKAVKEVVDNSYCQCKESDPEMNLMMNYMHCSKCNKMIKKGTDITPKENKIETSKDTKTGKEKIDAGK